MPNPLAFISDIHGNSPALRAVLEDIRRFDCGQIFVIGDIINGLDPAGCMNLLLETPHITALKGNAEFYLLTPDLDAFPRGEESMYKDLIGLIQWWHDQLSPYQLQYLQSLPDFIVWNKWLLVHDSPEGRMYPQTRYVPGLDEKYQEMLYHDQGLVYVDSETEAKLSAFMDEHDVSGIFVGHTHQPFIRAIGGKFVCNTGSVGMPLDGDPRPAWVLVEGSGDITIRRVEYNIAEVHALVDNTLDYYDFKNPGRADAFKKMYETGTYWRVYMPKGDQ